MTRLGFVAYDREGWEVVGRGVATMRLVVLSALLCGVLAGCDAAGGALDSAGGSPGAARHDACRALAEGQCDYNINCVSPSYSRDECESDLTAQCLADAYPQAQPTAFLARQCRTEAMSLRCLEVALSCVELCDDLRIDDQGEFSLCRDGT
jgi:hypothetical protein